MIFRISTSIVSGESCDYGKPFDVPAAELHSEVSTTPHFLFRHLLCTRKLQTAVPGADRLGRVMAILNSAKC